MIGKGLKELAERYQMQVEEGLAHGYIGNFYVTLSEGMGYKALSAWLNPPEDADTRTLISAKADALLQECAREYRLHPELKSGVRDGVLTVYFYDTVRTMQRVERLVAEFLPQLETLGFGGERTCARCYAPLERDSVIVHSGEMVVPMHSACENALVSEIAQEEILSADTGKHVFRGAIGALLGAIVGGAVWAAVMAVGYFLSLIGLLIAFLSEKGYALFGGKPCRAKVAVLVVCVLVGVAIGVVGGYSILFAQVYDETVASLTEYEYMIITKSEFVLDCWLGTNLWTDGEFVAEFVKNAGMSLLFAGLGCYGVLRNAHREAKPRRVKRMSGN